MRSLAHKLKTTRGFSIQCTVRVLTEHHWQPVPSSACDSQVGSKGDKSGGCDHCQRTWPTVVDKRSPNSHASPTPVRVYLREMWDDIVEEEPTQPVPAATEGQEAPPSAEGAPAAAEGEAKPEEAETPLPENPGNSEQKRLVFKHWIRPRTSQYNYIYDYQKNYYDDLITYLDRRNMGLPVELPRAQTWGERALRTYLSNTPVSYLSKNQNKDQMLLRHISMGAKFQRSHTKSLISRKYSHFRISTAAL